MGSLPHLDSILCEQRLQVLYNLIVVPMGTIAVARVVAECQLPHGARCCQVCFELAVLLLPGLLQYAACTGAVPARRLS